MKILDITKFEKDYMIFKIGCFEFLDKSTISYFRFKLSKVKDFWYNVIYLDIVIFEGILKDCLEFMEGNRNELYPTAIPKMTTSIRGVNESINVYKEFMLKRFNAQI